jgi:hypothetical protein
MIRVATATAGVVLAVLLVGAQPAAARPPFPDTIGTADLLSLERAVPGVMTDWVAAGRADGEVGDRDVLGMIMNSIGDDADTARRELLAGVLTERMVEPQVEHFAAEFWSALYLVQPSTVYVGNRFEIASWESAQVLGDIARVRVSARQHYVFPNGTEGAEPWHRYLIVLERDPDARYGWLLVERSASQDSRPVESVADR